ncbi:hypothetical protein CHU92_13175 [Flavobacterium cyanobacteriorum]|uniref:PAS domain-containing protein n=1 Tax=Flavobacterium cyanobacteriorum TaxID=2022802 RepID=A0A255YVK5_9FLAO|nr:PAS domain-containing protein [Flavobacterium cyanobacteriorum]OYQ33209.1 hypothetical protein CHU92_13175 [Flavobacterium cyanobacteriorum]
MYQTHHTATFGHSAIQRHAVRPPLYSWDFFSQYFQNRLAELSKYKDLSALNKLKARFGWHIDFDAGDFTTKAYQAIVVTDSATKIVWVNPGFSSMTGYYANEALGRTPKFLQGEKVSVEASHKIRIALDNKEQVSANVINYRKSGEEYLCEVAIYPLFGKNNEVTHFIALEREIA